jgi:ABC-type nitrate/sulfonate/bicarbonate transport system ATPase subunit
MAAIELREVTKRFGSVTALAETSLSIADGEFVSILGPSGCGKSTLLFIVAGLERASAGEVICGGVAVTGPGRERNVVFQEYALFPWRDVLGNVTIGLEGHVGAGELEKRARHYVSLVGLAGFEHHYPHQLSGGMKQRTALARALAMEPEVLLMDEPFAAVDAQTRESLQEELLRIWSGNKMTVLFVTHSIEESIYLSERVVVMKPGGIKEMLRVDEAYPRSYGFRTSETASVLRTQLHELLR